MADRRKDPGDGPRFTEKEYDDQRRIMIHLLHRHPLVLSMDQLNHEVETGPDYAGDEVEVEGAVRQLAALGMVHRVGPLVMPASAMLMYQQVINEFGPHAEDDDTKFV